MQESAHHEEKASPALIAIATVLAFVAAGIYLEKHRDEIASFRIQIPGVSLCSDEKPMQVPCLTTGDR